MFILIQLHGLVINLVQIDRNINKFINHIIKHYIGQNNIIILIINYIKIHKILSKAFSIILLFNKELDKTNKNI